MSCLICWSEFDEDSLIYETNCKPVSHKFHIECIQLAYLLTKQKECPYCRQNLNISNYNKLYPKCKYILIKGQNKGTGPSAGAGAGADAGAGPDDGGDDNGDGGESYGGGDGDGDDDGGDGGDTMSSAGDFSGVRERDQWCSALVLTDYSVHGPGRRNARIGSH